MQNSQDKFLKEFANGMDAVKDENNPFNIMLSGLNAHYESLGYDKPQSKFLTCVTLGYVPPTGETRW